MLEELKKRVWEANLKLFRSGLVILTFGNVSGIDRRKGLVVIKPSGVPYEQLKPEEMVVVDLEGKVREGKLKPSMDTLTHLELYKKWKEIGGVCHTHSLYATAFAQAEKTIPCLGTTHADHFQGEIPITRSLTREEIESNYEKNTGRVIVESLEGVNPKMMSAVLVAKHGPFSWGKSPEEAVLNSILLEEIAKMAFTTLMINPKAKALSKYLLYRHFFRKHGPKAIYGQKRT